ncbi:MAG TPA: hypothetical protein VJT69_06730 [Pyrinomonadaceae bacterium]|nr:hypothetical protein [Pyrinomonadaceae bacterium]
MGRSKVLFAALFLFLTVSVVNAYTVVMRDGRRVEIPNEFTVTNSTLTYDVGNGIQITMQLNTVDIAATERANGQAQGSFLMKATPPKVPVAPVPQPAAQRSITNTDLEKFRRARVEGENEYEKRRQEQGLPSMEERRREVAEIEDRTVEHVRNMRAQEEAYWRSRTEALRAEAAANEARMGALRQQPQVETPWAYSWGGFPAFGPFDNVGFGITGGPFGRFGRFRSSPFDGFLATPITPFPRVPFTGRRNVFTPRGVQINPRPMHKGHGSRR